MKPSEIRARMAALMQESKGLLDAHPDMDFPADAYERMVAIDRELGDLKGQLTTANQAKDLVNRFNSYNEYLEVPAAGGTNGMTFPSANGNGTNNGTGAGGGEQKQEQRKSVSQLVLSDAAYQDWYHRVAPHDNFSKGVKLESPQVMVPGGLKALVTGTADASAGAFIFNDVQRNLDQFLIRRPLVMRDIITIGQTGVDTVEYVQEISETNNAAMVPEAQSILPIGDGTGGTTTAALGGLKPESAMVFGRVTANVKTVAHWIPATKRALSDAGQMSTLIDNFLRYGLEEELEDQMILGNNVGENFMGLTNIPNVTAQAFTTNMLVTTRMAKTKVRTVGRSRATAFLLNPYDWQTIQLSRTNEGGANTGSFLFGGPASNEVPTLWQLPVVECESVPQGTGYVGNFKTLVLWDREQAGVQMTDSHADFFIRNLVMILAEARAAFGCLRPSSIVEFALV